MKILCENDLSVSEIASYLGKPYHGNDFSVKRVASEGEDKVSEALLLLRSKYFRPRNQQTIQDCCLIITDRIEDIRSYYPNATFVESSEAKFDFLKTVNEFFCSDNPYVIDETAKIHQTAKVESNVFIGSNSVISENVILSHDCYIGSNVVIGPNVTVGARAIIKPGSIIGAGSFDFGERETKLSRFQAKAKLLSGKTF